MILAALAVSIPMTIDNCTLDTAVIVAIPPATFHIITIRECGGLEKCWERSIETYGVRVGAARACAVKDSSFTLPSPVP